jgi:hypothetical protein
MIVFNISKKRIMFLSLILISSLTIGSYSEGAEPSLDESLAVLETESIQEQLAAQKAEIASLKEALKTVVQITQGNVSDIEKLRVRTEQLRSVSNEE